MTPLTVDCARIRQLLPGYHDGALEDSEQEFVASHVQGCAGCADSLLNLESALSALDTLSALDVERLRGELPESRPDLDVRPLATLVGLATAAVLLLLAGSAWWGQPAAAPATTSGPPRSIEVQALMAPLVVGGSVGIEEDPTLLIDHTPRVVPAEPPEAVAPPPEEQLVAAVEPPPDPVPAAAADPDPVPDDAGPDPDPDDPGDPPPAPLESPPDQVVAMLTRLQVAQMGIRYREVSFYFIRDPDGRDRVGRGATTTALLSVREGSPPDPEECVLRPPRGERTWPLLAGELLDGPYGLRIAPESLRLRGRSAVPVVPVSFVGLDPSAKRAYPLLKGPVLLPSRARYSLLAGVQPGPVAELLKALNDPSLLELRELQRQLARVEPEARDLERRLRSRVRDTRGLRGLGITIRGRVRSQDVFASSGDLSLAFPRLIRSALLENELESEIRDALEEVVEQPPKGFQEVDATRDGHMKLLTLLPKAQREQGQRGYEIVTPKAAGALVVTRDDLLHAAVCSKP